jgi:hypothetical protein
MNPSNGLSNTQLAYENNSKNLLDSIQKLTSTETDLLKQVTNLAGVDTNASGVNTSDLNNPETNKRIKKLLAEIENIEQIKTSIYNTLTSSYQLTQQQIDAIRPVVANSNVANQLMADALNVKLEQLGEQIDLHNNSERLIGVNNYYARRYEAHSSVMKKIVLFCGIIILVIFLMKIGFINDSISSILIIATLAVGIVIVGKQVWDISRRSNIDFDKYNFPFNDKNLPSRTTNKIDKKTDETYGRQWISNLCSDITKTASSVENSIAGDVGDNSAAADAGSGAGAGSTNASGSTIPQPSSTVTTTSPMTPSMGSQESFVSSKGGSRMLNACNVPSGETNYYTKVPEAYNC